MNLLPQEQPPVKDDPRLSEWLSRTIILINGALETVYTLPIDGKMPTTIEDGMIKFFNSSISPDIEYAGPWIVIDGKWEAMTTPVTLIQRIAESAIVEALVENPREIQGYDYTDQNPSGLDNPLQVKFGLAQEPVNGPIHLLADGTVKCMIAGTYNILVDINCSRTGNNQFATIGFYVEENGSIDVPPELLTITSKDDLIPFKVSASYSMEVGDEVKLFVYRDSNGVDDGGLHAKATSLSTIGDMPSAAVRITKWELSV